MDAKNRELLLKACQGMWFPLQDLEELAKGLLKEPMPPEGRSIETLALIAYVNDMLADARKLQSKLSKLN